MVEPTSVTMQPGGTTPERSAKYFSKVKIGVARMTRSAVAVAAARSPAIWVAMPRALALRRVAGAMAVTDHRDAGHALADGQRDRAAQKSQPYDGNLP